MLMIFALKNDIARVVEAEGVGAGAGGKSSCCWLTLVDEKLFRNALAK